MKVYRSAYAKTNRDSAVALGCFDGVHIGHEKIIKNAVAEAKKNNLYSVVWSFSSPPKSFFSKDDTQKNATITPFSKKQSLIKKLGADMLICTKFDEKIASLEPEEFFKVILIDCLRAKQIFCGFNYKFGKNGRGDTALLSKLCKEYNVKLSITDEIKINEVSVSSSAIRSYLLDGNIESAQAMLGRSYSIRERIKDGQHLGRTLGFPTINQSIPKDHFPLKNGVYLTKSRFLGKEKYGITNIGMRPTVKGKERVAETHIFDFCGDLYGKYVTVEFIKFIRAERKFDSLEDLTIQVNKDIQTAKALINT